MADLLLHICIVTAYAVAALVILVGTAWYSDPYRWVRRILVASALALHFVAVNSIVGFSAIRPLWGLLIVAGSIVFTAWIYWLARNGSKHLVHVLNLCIVVIMIQNYRTRDLYGIGLLGRIWIH
jgi:hypothetical protein